MLNEKIWFIVQQYKEFKLCQEQQRALELEEQFVPPPITFMQAAQPSEQSHSFQSSSYDDIFRINVKDRIKEDGIEVYFKKFNFRQMVEYIKYRGNQPKFMMGLDDETFNRELGKSRPVYEFFKEYRRKYNYLIDDDNPISNELKYGSSEAVELGFGLPSMSFGQESSAAAIPSLELDSPTWEHGAAAMPSFKFIEEKSEIHSDWNIMTDSGQTYYELYYEEIPNKEIFKMSIPQFIDDYRSIDSNLGDLASTLAKSSEFSSAAATFSKHGEFSLSRGNSDFLTQDQKERIRSIYPAIEQLFPQFMDQNIDKEIFTGELVRQNIPNAERIITIYYAGGYSKYKKYLKYKNKYLQIKRLEK
jgi:hypothetical protein